MRKANESLDYSNSWSVFSSKYKLPAEKILSFRKTKKSPKNCLELHRKRIRHKKRERVDADKAQDEKRTNSHSSQPVLKMINPFNFFHQANASYDRKATVQRYGCPTIIPSFHRRYGFGKR